MEKLRITKNQITSTEDIKPSPESIKISGRFDQYRSSYWAALVAILPLRYLIKPFVRKNWDIEDAGHFDKHKYAAVAGVFISAVTGYYALTTWKDMRNIFCQSLAWEFNKDPKDIGFRDFWKSKNTIVQHTIHNYVKYNSRRFIVNGAFFTPFIFKPLFKKYNLHPETGVDFGVAANAAYLFSDVMTRKITPFEDLQSLIDRKVNHSEHFSEDITASDLLDVYERNAGRGITSSFLSQRGTPQWEESMALFARMADLLNQTYKNTLATEKADFSFPKFIYLVGNGMIDPNNPKRSRAYVEIANRYGIEELKKADIELKSGLPLEALVKKYGIDLSTIATQQSTLDNSLVVSMAAREQKRRAEQATASLGLA